ncbi:hypothetical protein IPdc08_01389 [archaeon]|nr:hypothetical protein IPdc08_01389 [archaeon]
MQKLLVEFQNTPEDAPQVLCSVSGVLNREETPQRLHFLVVKYPL